MVTDAILQLSAFEVVAVAMCVVWVWVNAYHMVPVAVGLVTAGLGRLPRRRRPAPVGVTDGGPDTTIDVFLPVYHEAGILQQAMESVLGSDYPAELLSLYVLTEPDDEETRRSLASIDDRYAYTELTVPEWYPGEQNKPRALNYAFERSDGDVVCIVDAEDIVSEGLFREGVAMLDAGEADYVQGRLDMVNEDDGWLNTLFRAEYGYWYRVNLPAQQASDFPIPLGGTTCLLPRRVLERTSQRRIDRYGHPWTAVERADAAERGFDGWVPWDPRNVTEDFELGLLLWSEGYQAGYLAETPTAEESPLTLDAWVRQRTRWEKGKMYTLIQYLRHPPRGLRRKFHLYTQSLVPHLGPVNLLSLVVLLLGANVAGVTFHPLVQRLLYAVAAMSLFVVACYGYGYWTVSDAPRRTRVRRTAIVVLTVPLYWLLQWIAEVHAIRETYAGRFHWSKTTHLGRNRTTSERLERRHTWGTYTLGRRWRVGGLAVILVGATALRAWGLDSRSLTVAEVQSLTETAGTTDGVLYPAVVEMLLSHGGTLPVARVLSVALSALAILLVYRLGVDLFDDRTGLVAALLVAVSTFHVNLGRSALPYALVTVLAVGSWLVFLRVLGGSTRAAAAHLCLSLALVLTSPFGALVALAQGAYLVLAEPRQNENRRTLLLAGGASVVVAFVAVTVLVAREFRVERAAVDVASPLTVALGLVGDPAVSGGAPTRTLAVAVLALLATAVLFSAVRVRLDGHRAFYEFDSLSSVAQVALLLVVPFVGTAVLAAVTGLPEWTAAATPASIGLALLGARGITNVPLAWVRVGLLVFLVAGSGTLVSAYYDADATAEWGPVTGCVEPIGDGDVVLVEPAWAARTLLADLHTDGATPTVYVVTDDPATTAALRRLASTETRVYLVQYRPSPADSDTARSLASMYATSGVVERGAMRIVQYDITYASPGPRTGANATRCATV